MRCKLLACIAVALLLPISSAFAVGEAGVPSLIIPPGARPNGMGESFVAIADDATAAWWNAGGLAFMEGQNLALMHSQLVPDLANDVYYEWLGYTNRIKNFGTLSIALIYLTYGESVATNVIGQELGTFKSWEAAILVSFAIPLTPNLGLGLTGKFIHADLAPADLTLEKLDGSGSTVAVDAGILWKWKGPKLNLGAAVANLGPDISFIDQEQSDPLPITLRLGTACVPEDHTSRTISAPAARIDVRPENQTPMLQLKSTGMGVVAAAARALLAPIACIDSLRVGASVAD